MRRWREALRRTSFEPGDAAVEWAWPFIGLAMATAVFLALQVWCG